MNKHDKTVKLPKEHFFKKNETWQNFFKLMDEINSSELPMIERDNDPLEDMVGSVPLPLS